MLLEGGLHWDCVVSAFQLRCGRLLRSSIQQHPTVCSCMFSTLSSQSVQKKDGRQKPILPPPSLPELLGFCLGNKLKLTVLFAVNYSDRL